jgi:hypothetical protein
LSRKGAKAPRIHSKLKDFRTNSKLKIQNSKLPLTLSAFASLREKRRSPSRLILLEKPFQFDQFILNKFIQWPQFKFSAEI